MHLYAASMDPVQSNTFARVLAVFQFRYMSFTACRTRNTATASTSAARNTSAIDKETPREMLMTRTRRWPDGCVYLWRESRQ
jgi:hypothetical protein